MEASWIGHSALPALILSSLAPVLVYPKHVCHQLLRHCSPPQYSEVQLQPSFPPKVSDFSSILQLITVLVCCAQVGASQLRVLDIRKEELTLWAQLNLVVLVWICFGGGNENFKHILIKEVGVAADKSRDDVGVNHRGVDI